jgi:selenium metabolism protein YedF
MVEKKIVDCRGLACPQPVIDTKEALAGSASPILVIVDDEASCTNVRRFAESQGARVSLVQQNDEFHLTIEPVSGGFAGREPPIVCTTTGAKNTVVYISSESMGRGDEKLGAILMAAFLDTLAQFKDELSHVIFVNAGARLAVEGSPVLEQLRQLEQVGAKVLVCGTCLGHFGIEDKLAVGSVSNMYAIIDILAKATRIINP